MVQVGVRERNLVFPLLLPARYIPEQSVDLDMTGGMFSCHFVIFDRGC